MTGTETSKNANFELRNLSYKYGCLWLLIFVGGVLMFGCVGWRFAYPTYPTYGRTDDRNWLGNVLENAKGFLGTYMGFAADIDTVVEMADYMDNSFVSFYSLDCSPRCRVDVHVFDVE